MSHTATSNRLDPSSLAKLSRLEIVARLVVEGFISGLHKSPHKGFSVEFAEHRQYTIGDNIRDIDWKVFAKSDRFFIKQYEEETNLRAYLLLDASGSMNYAGPAERSRRRKEADGVLRPTKFRYASCLASALSYLMLQQRDAVGLVTFDREVRRYIPPRATAMHLRGIFEELDRTRTGGETNLSRIFHDLAERFRKRGLIVILSDLFDEPDKLAGALQHFRHKKHEVVVFHILDDDELTFPFEHLTQFEGMEIAAERLLVEPRQLRDDYLAQVKAFTDRVRRLCWQHKIDYVPMRTSEPFDNALATYLARRLEFR
ncbi:MAG: DUF58 domain-containing protein [Verrucomicrobia bacterium]|nr:DUF58 domain-containing protein [Verrucomicrobiota bacterium]